MTVETTSLRQRAQVQSGNQLQMEFISRHLKGDWGECCEEDRQANEDALQNGERLFSVYRTAKGAKIWVITEADRSSTCVLLPGEY